MRLAYQPAVLVLAASTLAFPAGSVRIGYAAAEGSTWQKTFEVTTELGFDDLSVVMNGQEVDPQFLPQIEMDATDTTYVEVTDVVVEVGDGGPRLVHRTYEGVWREAEQTMEMVGMMPEPVETAVDGTSPLEGRTVAFTWEEGSDVASSAFADDGGADDALLADVAADMDLLAWLPDHELEEGDSWTVPADAIEAVLSPGGDLSIELEGEGAEEFTRGEGGEHEYEGELTLRLAALRSDDGERLAVIEIEGDFALENTYEGNLDQIPVVDGTATNTDKIDYELKGELAWDLASGVLRSLEAQADVIIESHTVKDPGQEGPEYESTAMLSGTMTFQVSVEAAD